MNNWKRRLEKLKSENKISVEASMSPLLAIKGFKQATIEKLIENNISSIDELRAFINKPEKEVFGASILNPIQVKQAKLYFQENQYI